MRLPIRNAPVALFAISPKVVEGTILGPVVFVPTAAVGVKECHVQEEWPTSKNKATVQESIISESFRQNDMKTSPSIFIILRPYTSEKEGNGDVRKCPG